MTEASARIIIDRLLRESDWVLSVDDAMMINSRQQNDILQKPKYYFRQNDKGWRHIFRNCIIKILQYFDNAISKDVPPTFVVLTKIIFRFLQYIILLPTVNHHCIINRQNPIGLSK